MSYLRISEMFAASALGGTEQFEVTQGANTRAATLSQASTYVLSQLTDAQVTGKLLTGFVAGSNTAIAATDTLLEAFAKLQGQVSARITGNQTISLSGDVSGSGATSITATLATVNSNVGSFGAASTVPVITVNGKGLITAVSTATVVAAAGTLTGSTLASGVTASSLTSVGTLTSLTMGGTLSLVTGTATVAPLKFTAGTNLTAAVAGSVEWDGTNLYITQTTGPTRKTVAYTDSSITGNAATATKLQTARLINGVSFDGTADITVTAAAGTLTGTTLNSTVVTSSLTTVGTVSTGTWSASFGAVSGANLTNLTAGNLTGTISSAVLGNSTVYIGTTAVALNRASANLAFTGVSSITLPGVTSGSVQVIPTAAAGTGTVLTLPATTGTVVTTGDTGTVTNTMLAGSIANNKLTNSSVTVNGTSIALGASGTVTADASTLTGTTLNATVVSSSLTSVGTLGSLTVTGAITANGGVALGTIGKTDTASLTTSTTTANQVVASVSSTAYRSVKFYVQVTSGAAYQATEIYVVHDGTTTYVTEYGTILSGASLASFACDINTGNLRLLVTPVNAATTIKTVYTAIAV